MRCDFVEKTALCLYSRSVMYANRYLPRNRATRIGVVLSTTLSLQITAAAELVEHVFMTVVNLATFSQYDALVYLRKSALSLIKVAASPLTTIGLPILYFLFKPKDVKSEAVIDIYRGYRSIFGNLVDPYLPRPRADKERLLAAIDRECKSFGKLDLIRGLFVQAQGDSGPIFITDEWHRYWELSKWQKTGYYKNEPIEVRQLAFAGWIHGGDAGFQRFTLSLEHTNKIREMLASKK